MKKLACVDFDGSEFEDSYWNELDSFTEKRVLVATAAEVPQDTDGLLVKLGATYNKDMMAKLPNLKYIGMLGTGFGGIDSGFAKSKGITVTNIADYATEGVTEFTFGILLEYLRDLGKARSQAKEGNYSDDFSGSEIKGKKFGVIGLGDIGVRTARLALAFGAEVSYWSRNRKKDAEDAGIKYRDLDDLINESDIVTLNLALTTETEGIITAARVGKFKSNAIFINPSPMELIDFSALTIRLKKDDMIFMLDHSDEMSEVQLGQLRPLKNAIVYPAIAYLTHEATELKKRIFIDNVKNYVAGTPTNNVTSTSLTAAKAEHAP